MPEWLVGVSAPDTPVTPEALAARLALAVAGGAAVAAIHWTSRRPGPEGVPLVGTFVLLSAVIALVTVAIGGNLARAFGLVAALSIIRFRTAVDDTRDTAFVIFAVGVGMMLGTGYLVQAAVGIPIVGAAAWMLAGWERWCAPSGGGTASLKLKLAPGMAPDAVLAGVFGDAGHVIRLTAAETCRKGTAMEFTYAVRWRGTPALGPLVMALQRVDGVEAVEIKQGN